MKPGRLEELFCERGLKMSDQRRVILQVIDSSTDHPSAEGIYLRARKHDPRLSIATVYRTINLLTEAGLLTRIELGGGKARYENDRGIPHEHLLDVDSGHVVELSDPAIRALLSQIVSRSGYRLLDYRLEVFGQSTGALQNTKKPRRALDVGFRERLPTR